MTKAPRLEYFIGENTMPQKKKEFIQKHIDLAHKYKDELLIILVMNVKGLTNSFKDYSQSSVISEYYSYSQYEEIFNTIKLNDYSVRCYFDENDFISDYETGIIRNNYPRKMLVINSAQKGIGLGRKSLIPAFCQLHNILCASSDPYTVSFARNKFHWYCFLKLMGFPVCPSWYYSRRIGWISEKRPPLGETIIIKVNSESSSIGLTQSNIVKYSPTTDSLIDEISKKYNQDIIAEKFICGYETEVPVLISSTECCSLFPAGISIGGNKCLGNKILDYNIRGNHKFSHYDFRMSNPKIAKSLEQLTERIATAVGIRNMGRIDYRIDSDDNAYITDIATNPHITKSMTFYYEYQKFGLTYADVLDTLVGLALSWENL